MSNPNPLYSPTGYLSWNAGRRPGAPALIDSGKSITFAELLRAVGSAATRLAAGGVGRGSVVGLRLPNIWEYAALELAIPYLGGINLPLPPALGTAEMSWATGRTGARHVIDSIDEAARLCALGIPHSSPVQARAPDRDRIVEIALTSGTTGLPKLASLSAGLKQATFEAFTDRLAISEEDRVLIMSPLTQGIGGMCLYALRRGAALVMLREERFRPEHILETAQSARATALVGVPTNVIRMLASPSLRPDELRRVRITAVAGSPMPPDVAERWEQLTGSRVCPFYGSMDAGQIAVASPDDPPEKRWTSVGRPHDCLEVVVIDGEICARGPTIQARYWGESFGPYGPDGWAHMGDLGRLDGDGYLHVEGRIKDVIIRGGSNVNPYEVENLIRRHPAVTDVCVVGRADPELGERAVAFVVATERVDLDELRAYLSEAGLARYKWPERLERIEEIPLAGPGKVDRRRLRQQAEALTD